MWDVLNKYSDPDGITAPKPIMPTKELNLDLHLGGFSLIRTKSVDPSIPEWGKIVESLKRGYRKIRTESLAGLHKYNGIVDREIHLRVLNFWEEKYGVDYEQFIPGDLPDEGMRPHRTIITDDFNRTDGELGANWTDDNGDADILSNQWDVTSD